ncbi:GNAT family N-acetyltransferase [Phenylobacterium sp.]|uniref:GNAT family N-acetyltransferase n=1 Tax=Phenylobacterium sp. TaxID=1871053 RepID=UPI002FE2C883
MVELRTPRLRLRRARPDDLEPMHAVLSHPVAMRYWSTTPHEDLAQTEAWLADMIATDGEDFVIEREGRVIGKAGCYSLPEVGYILHPDAWGQGFASEALGAATAHVFAARAVDRLTADVDPRNAASLALLKKLGFAETGRAARTWLIGGEWCDSVYLALDRPATIPRP